MRIVPLFVMSSLLVMAGCSKDEPESETTSPETSGNGDGDGDAPTTTAGDGDGAPGDGDGSPGNTSMTGFVPDEDVIGAAACDPLAQDCPEGEKCIAYSSTGDTWDANKCVPVTGSNAPGDSCVYNGANLGTDDCDATSVCWNAIDDGNGVLVGTCYPFCTGSVDNPMCDDPAQSCRVVNEGVITICLPRCDPLLQDCAEGLGCYWSGTSGTFQCIITAGGIPTGEPCGYNNDCNPGNFCADAAALDMCNGSACCAAYCDLTEDPTPCLAPLECVSFFDEGTAPPEYMNLGLCILPQ
jgi:hypothetical protein